MTDKLKDAIAVLKQFNEWRRGAETPQLDPKVIGEAIDEAVDFIVNHKTYYYGKKWTIEVGFDQITLYYLPIEGGPPTVSAYNTLKEALDAAQNLAQ